VRRLGFIVDFPFPNAAEREQIWRRVFPPNVLDIDEKKDYRKLAQLNVSGGNIRSIALGAAFKAADAGDSKIRMPHILLATKREYQKTERTLTQAEVYGWLG
jgi:ATP-dependent 26S proteasome regulatory subunit